MDLTLSSLHVIVTGGTGALGSAIARQLTDAGARCSIPCFRASEPEHFPLAGHEHMYLETGVDLTDEEAVQRFYASAVDRQGPLWASIHTAGGFGMGAIEATPGKDFMKQLHLNTLTCYHSCRAAIHHIRSSGHEGGRIVNVAARPALEPRQGKRMTAYTVSKAGVAALTQSLAAEVAGEDILVNAVAPSVIDTPANRNAMPDANFDNWPKPDEIAGHILYLASPANTVTRGAVIPVYGKS